MKAKILSCCTLLLLVSVFGASTYTAHAAQDSETIRVGYSSLYTDFVYDLDSLNNKGYGYDVFQKIEEVSDLEFEFVAIDGDVIEAARTGFVDVAGLSIRSEERAENVLFSDTPLSKTYIALMTKDMSISYADYESMDGKTVATYEGNIGQESLGRFCEYYDISVNYVYSDVHHYMDLDADFYIVYSEHRDSTTLNNVLNLGVYNLFLVSNFENSELLDKIDTIFLDVVTTEGNFFLELEEKYHARNLEISHRSLLNREIEQLQERPLEVGYITGYRPISFTNEQGEADGAMVDVLNLLAERYGFEVNYHPYSLSDDPALHENFDILITLYGDGVHDFEYYVPTEPYYNLPLFAQVHNNILDASEDAVDILELSSKIGMLQYQSIEYDIFREAFPENDIIFYDDFNTLLDAFADKQLDTIISTESAVTYATLYLDDVDRTTVHTDLSVPMQFYISKDIADEYIPIFNVMFDRVSEDEYRNILNLNSDAFLPERSTIEVLMDVWYLFVIGLAVIIFIMLAFWYSQQKQKQHALIVAYSTDRVTRLPTLSKFSEMAQELIESSNPGEYEMISLDIDMFKAINTYYSTDRGTSVIQAVASALKKAFEGTPTLITRRAGERFLVLRRVIDGDPLTVIYEQFILPGIRDVIGDKYNISMSFGNVIVNNPKDSITNVIGRADNARSKGKGQHVTTFITYDEAMGKLYDDRINFTFRMEQALADREFFVVYQPKIDFGSLQIGGAEALVRWKPRLGDMIYPDAFIPVFEGNGFISNLDMYVLEEVCKFIIRNGRAVNLPRISVNLSAFSITDNTIITRISDIIDRHGVRTNEIEFEVTESAIIGDESKFLQRVKQLKKLGFHISIDDFGAGVSSLNRLSSIEADVLKLDKAFFDLKDQGGKSNVVVADVISMAKHLDMLVVAEGVETFAQALWLREIKCDFAQGYYFEKPMSADDFLELLSYNRTYEIKP